MQGMGFDPWARRSNRLGAGKSAHALQLSLHATTPEVNGGHALPQQEKPHSEGLRQQPREKGPQGTKDPEQPSMTEHSAKNNIGIKRSTENFVKTEF